MPILNTCKAHMEEIEKCIKETLDVLEPIKNNADPSGSPIKFSCIYKSSNNQSLSRDEMFKLVGSYFNSKNKLNKVDFDNPDYVLLIQVICNIAFISFVDNYFNYRKYNIVEMGAKFIKSTETKAIEKASSSSLTSSASAPISNDDAAEKQKSSSGEKNDIDSLRRSVEESNAE